VREIQDSEFLRILRENPVVPQDEVRSAQETQRDELDRQGSCRSLFAILREKGLIDERVARTVASVPAGDRPGDVTPHTPTVVLAHSDQTPIPGRTSSSSTISNIRTSRRLPPEVESARAEPKNVLGPYILVREVGKGGMGRVYRAWDQNVGRYVAVKVIDTEDVNDRERFVREAQIAGRLHHPAIATVYQAGEQGTRGYIAMQYIEGGPIDAHKLPLAGTLAMIRDAAQALTYAHEQGVIHRDVKPGNLMVDGKDHVFLTDFGLAKEVVGNAGTQLSITGTTFGTPQYMSPEQARGEHKKMDGRCDVYSLGATLYALLARRPPFTTTNLATLLLEVLEKTPPPLRKFNREISPELQMVVERAMAKDASKRYPTMVAFGGALDELIRTGRYAGRYGLARSLARRWLPRLAIVAALAVAARFALPVLLAPKKPPEPAVVDPAPGWYADAASALRTIEGQDLSPELRRDRVDAQVLPPLKRVLERRPEDLRSRALLLRAQYARGDGDEAARGLAALESHRADDYRLPWIGALRALEKALTAPCPLPAFEGPEFEWERPPAPPDAGIEEVVKAKVEPELRAEYDEDRAAIEGLSCLALGQYAKAAELLSKNKLPVFQAARWRAVYLAQGFREILDAKGAVGSAERFGAAFALAAGSAEKLEALLPSAGDRAPSVHAALARLDDAGRGEEHVAEGLKGAWPERRAALESVRLRKRARSGTDEESAWREALKEAGERPSTSQGKLAAVELRLGLGARLMRSKGDGRPLLEEAASRADGLAKANPKWGAPALLAAQARLRLGRLEEARADLQNLPEAAKRSVGARLAWGALELASAERERKAGGAYLPSAKAAQEALGAPRGSAEALALLGAALLLQAQHAAEAGQDEGPAVKDAWEALTGAIAAEPGYVEARFHRARANFLRAELSRRRGGDGKAEGEEALADADAALTGWPDFAAARYLRGVVNFSLGRDAEAVADWRLLIRADAAWDTPDVRSWIQRAEGRRKQ
jgi:hypothetical protein